MYILTGYDPFSDCTVISVLLILVTKNVLSLDDQFCNIRQKMLELYHCLENYFILDQHFAGNINFYLIEFYSVNMIIYFKS